MSDEAVLRIVLDDSGGPPQPPPPAPGTSTSTSTGPSPLPRTPPPPPPPAATTLLPPPRTVVQPPAPPPKGAPGKVTSDLDQITQSLGMGSAFKEVQPPTPPPATPTPKPTPQQPAPTSTPAPSPPIPPRDWMRDLVDGIAGANRHVLVEGESGSGKSSIARNVAFERAKKGEEINVLDPHTPEMWKGVGKAFSREAAPDFANLMLSTLREREAQSIEAKSKGEKIDFKPVTFAMSDFAAIAKDFPELKKVMMSVLTEGRKFNLAVLAETAGFNAEEIGAGTVAMRRNFKQKVEAFAPGPGQPDRTVRAGGETFKTPNLADVNKDRFDPSIVQYKPTTKMPEEDEGEKKKPGLFDVAKSMRGTIGGAFGTVAGAGLDIASGIQQGVGAIGALGVAAAATTVAFNALTGVIDQSVQRYGEVNADVAAAQAGAEILHTLNDIRRGQEYGKDLAQYVQSQAQMQEKFEEAKMKFLSKIMPIIEAIFDMLGGVMEGVGAIPDFAMALATPLTAISASINESVAMQRDANLPDVKDPTDVILKDNQGNLFSVPNL